MSEKLHFKVSAGLKNIIGKELINDKFIAIFELVKNSYDAGADSVVIRFKKIYGNNPQIYIIDNGKGMSKDDIINKWLFVAYSEKKNVTYRDNVKIRRNYAGAKGVGRFSCDRLGEKVELFSKTTKDKKVNYVNINWNDFENTDNQEFQDITVNYDLVESTDIKDQGTIIKISDLRESWDREELLKLKKSLTQLVNPESNDNYDKYDVYIDVEDELQKDLELKAKMQNQKDDAKDFVYEKDIVNGLIVNHVFDVLNLKTTKITAQISEDGKKIITSLNDRGIQLFKIEEKNKYSIKNVKGTVYSLNRSAKINFTKMMGIESVNYGSVFVYKNGFRVYPYGEPEKDFMNIDRRKAQGYNRYLGTREICGRIDIFGENKGFVETSSRNNGFISSFETEELENFFYEYLLKPLEKYVVNIIHWGEGVVDNDSLASSMELYDSLESVLKRIKPRFKTESLIQASFNNELSEIISRHANKKSEFGIDELKRIGIEKDDTEIIEQVDKIEKNAKKWQAEFENNRRNLEDAIEKHEATKKQLAVVQRQVSVLQSKEKNTTDNAIDAMHIMKAYADTIDSNIEEIFAMIQDSEPIDNIIPILHEIRQTCSKIMNAYNLIINTDYKADTGNSLEDIVQFTKTYVEKHWLPKNQIQIVVVGNKCINIPFNPLEFSIIIDNIIDNSKKANASQLIIIFEEDKENLLIRWRDDGYGLADNVSADKIFEQGYTSTKGTGIGLYTVRSYVEKMHGTVTVDKKYKSGFELLMRFRDGH